MFPINYIGGDGLNIWHRRISLVRIPPLALNGWDIGIFKKCHAVLWRLCTTVLKSCPNQKLVLFYKDQLIKKLNFYTLFLGSNIQKFLYQESPLEFHKTFFNTMTRD